MIVLGEEFVYDVIFLFFCSYEYDVNDNNYDTDNDDDGGDDDVFVVYISSNSLVIVCRLNEVQ